jgi:hypothetical protein
MKIMNELLIRLPECNSKLCSSEAFQYGSLPISSLIINEIAFRNLGNSPDPIEVSKRRCVKLVTWSCLLSTGLCVNERFGLLVAHITLAAVGGVIVFASCMAGRAQAKKNLNSKIKPATPTSPVPSSFLELGNAQASSNATTVTETQPQKSVPPITEQRGEEMKVTPKTSPSSKNNTPVTSPSLKGPINPRQRQLMSLLQGLGTLNFEIKSTQTDDLIKKYNTLTADDIPLIVEILINLKTQESSHSKRISKFDMCVQGFFKFADMEQQKLFWECLLSKSPQNSPNSTGSENSISRSTISTSISRENSISSVSSPSTVNLQRSPSIHSISLTRTIWSNIVQAHKDKKIDRLNICLPLDHANERIKDLASFTNLQQVLFIGSPLTSEGIQYCKELGLRRKIDFLFGQKDLKYFHSSVTQEQIPNEMSIPWQLNNKETSLLSTPSVQKTPSVHQIFHDVEEELAAEKAEKALAKKAKREAKTKKKKTPTPRPSSA